MQKSFEAKCREEGRRNLKRNEIYDALCEKDGLLQVFRDRKKECEDNGDASSTTYLSFSKQVREIERQHWLEASERAHTKE